MGVPATGASAAPTPQAPLQEATPSDQPIQTCNLLYVGWRQGLDELTPWNY